MSIVAPYWPYDKLRGYARDFLSKHNQSCEIPVRIGTIVEYDFGMDVVPIPGLLDSFEIDGFLSNDLQTIYVDDFVYKNRETRYRFSLAHELSHRLLHGDIIKSLEFGNIEEWKKAALGIPADQYGFIEAQAYGLAGLILVPEDALKFEFESAEKLAGKSGMDFTNLDSNERSIIESNLGRTFNVSSGVIKRRLDKDSLWP